MQLLCWAYRCGKQRIDRFYCLEHRIQSAVLPAYTAGDDMDCKEQESASVATDPCCDIGCKESANVCSSDALKGLDVANDGREEVDRSAKHAADAVEKDVSKKAQACAVVAIGTAAGNGLGSLLSYIEPSITPAAMQKPCLVYRCRKQRIDRFYCLEHRMQSVVKYDAPVDDMDCREQESSRTAINACSGNGCSEGVNVCDGDGRKGLDDGAMGVTCLAAAPANVYAFSKKTSLMRIEDVRTEEIPALSYMADLVAARERRAEEESSAASDKEMRSKKARTEAVVAAHTAVVVGQASPLPHHELSEVLQEHTARDVHRKMEDSEYIAWQNWRRQWLKERQVERANKKAREKRKHAADNRKLCSVDKCVKVAAHGNFCTGHHVAIAASLLPGCQSTNELHCNVAGTDSDESASVGDTSALDVVNAQTAALQHASPCQQPEVSEPMAALKDVDTKLHFQCQVRKPLTSFYKNKLNRLHSFCKECVALNNRVRINTRPGFISGLVAGSRLRSKRRGMNQNELTTAIFDGICRNQNDRCIYSGLPVNFAPMSDWQASIERLNNDEDYTISNSALCVLEFNVAAGWTAAKAAYAATHTDSVHTATVQTIVREALSTSATACKYPIPMQQKEEDGVIMTLCYKCSNWKHDSDFYKSDRVMCKGCCCDRAKQYASTWRGAFFMMVTHASQRCKTTTHEARGLVCNIRFDDVVNMYSEQGGGCLYSGIPLTTKGDWKVSLERRDVRVGYTRENCCLIAMEFQGTDYTAVSKYGGDGCSGWSREKYLFFRTNYNPANVPARPVVPRST
ncbi:hypothetical protein JKP88DRAFT_249410 [Tribonema minus]|uniref:Uncharacterized protein n=1 Tax=Tribonema minus TaxID=303371 RepID=A0A835YK65_9STRA|nr:hypothetical protein JKP88DRAFT_249410 [Tribonema minus]